MMCACTGTDLILVGSAASDLPPVFSIVAGDGFYAFCRLGGLFNRQLHQNFSFFESTLSPSPSFSLSFYSDLRV